MSTSETVQGHRLVALLSGLSKKGSYYTECAEDRRF